MEHPIGKLSRFTPQQIAERATDVLMGLTKPHAVCLDPFGTVTVEPFECAVIDDVVGVYSGDRGLIATYRDVRDDLVHAVQSRDVQAAARRYVRRAA